MEIYKGYEDNLVIEGISESVISSSRKLEIELDQDERMLRNNVATRGNFAYLFNGCLESNDLEKEYIDLSIQSSENFQSGTMFYKKFSLKKIDEIKGIKNITEKRKAINKYQSEVDWEIFFSLKKIDDHTTSNLCIFEYDFSKIKEKYDLFQYAAQEVGKWEEEYKKQSHAL